MAPAQTVDLKDLVCVGEITAPHGVKGGLRIRSFTSPPVQLFTYPLQNERGQPLALVQRGADPKPDLFIAELPGVTSRANADALRGTQLFVPRAALPEPAPDEYYLSDLIGLRCRTVEGEDAGRIIAVPDYGAGPLLEIRPTRGPTLLLPFHDDFVPTVDLQGGLVTIVMPDFVAGEPGREDEA